MTPSSNIPPTPDASTPVGGGTVLSPPLNPPSSFGERQDPQMSTDAESELIQSLSRPSSDTIGESPLGSGGPARVSPFQVENILGIRNDKPVNSGEHQQTGGSGGGTNTMEFERMNSLQSPAGEATTPFREHPQAQPAKRGARFNDSSEQGKASVGGNVGDRPEFLSIQSPVFSPLDSHVSPSLSEDGMAVKGSKVTLNMKYN